MVKIIWTHIAIDDLEDIFKYISKDSFLYAKRQVLKIRNCTEILKLHPKSGRIVPELNDKNIRELIEGNYRIIYRYLSVKNCIEILTIHNSYRNLIVHNIK